MLFASWVALFHFYTAARASKQPKTIKLLGRVLSKTTIPQGGKITRNDLLVVEMKRSSAFAIKQPPLSQIIGKYAKRTIHPLEFLSYDLLANQPIAPYRQSKPKTIQKRSSLTKHSQYPLVSEKFFQNPDITLRPGSHVDILAVTLKKEHPIVSYVAANVAFKGFVDKKTEKRQNTTKRVEKFFSFDISPRLVRDLFQKAYESLELNHRGIYSVFNRHHAHLWLVPTKADRNFSLRQIRRLYSKKAKRKKAKKSSVVVHYEE